MNTGNMTDKQIRDFLQALASGEITLSIDPRASEELRKLNFHPMDRLLDKLDEMEDES